jgi:putative DNA primase/helicase
MLRRLVDPNRADVRSECSNPRDLAIAAKNGHVLAFDNLSYISQQMSDALCGLCTGSAFATRKLYTDNEEMIFEAKRPIIITSIVDVAGRGDLADRCLRVELQPIPASERMTEKDLWAKYDAAQPKLLGALFDVVSVALRNAPSVASRTMLRPRMADAYNWALAAAPGVPLETEVLMTAWQRTCDWANAATLESSPIVDPLRQLLDDYGGAWSGTSSQLMEKLAERADETTIQQKAWPKSAKQLAAAVRCIAPALRATGIDHNEPPRTKNQRLHEFREVAIQAMGAGTPELSNIPSLF